MKVLIVGGVEGGAGAAARLRRNDESAQIILFEKGPYISFANCGLPYYIGDVITCKEALQLQTPQRFHDRFAVDVRVNNEVLSLDSENRQVEVVDHSTGHRYQESYDVLILSPGASPIRPPITGIDTADVFTLRNIPDTYAIKDYINTHHPRYGVVIGGGFIGLEMADNLHALGIEVSVIEASDHVIGPLDPDMAHDVHNHIRSKGISLYLNSMATEFTKDSVKLKDGRSVPADFILLSVGVRPETVFLKDSGIALGSRGEILVDNQFKTSLPHVYAVGDAIGVTNAITGQPTILPLASPANRQARLVADIVCGKPVRYSGVQGTSIAKVFDMTVAVTGESETSLKKAGTPYYKTLTFSGSHAGYYPGSHSMLLKLLYTPEGRVMGAQITGYEGVDKRIDVLATAIRHGMSVYDLQELELAYAPPYSSAKDPVNMAGYTAANVLEGTFEPFYLEDLDHLPADVQLIDVRTAEEFARGTIGQAINLPLDSLRSNLDQLDREKTVYLFCQVGLRGYLAERILAQHGFQVKNLSGGYRLYEAAQTDLHSGFTSKKEYTHCGLEKDPEK